MRLLIALGFLLTFLLTSCDHTPAVQEDVGTSSDAVGSVDQVSVDVALPPQAKIKIATFNVSRFFDTACDTGECWEGSYEDYPTPTEFKTKSAQLVKAIQALNADVVVLQEVENEACMKVLQDDLGGSYPTAVMGETGAPASLDVATLSRATVLDVRKHRNYSIPHPDGGWTKFSREFLEVHMEWKGWRVIVFNAHFKSKTNDDPGRRLAEAMKAREIMEASAKEYPYALIVLAGDINDVPNSPPLNELEKGGFMHRIAKEIPSGGDWTYNYYGNLRAIDHIFVVHAAWGDFEAGTAMVYRDNAGSGWGGSDHGAVVGSFVIKP